MKDNLVNELGDLVNDCISRRAAIDAAIEAVDDWDGGTNIGRQKRIEKAIKALPPVQSEPKSYRMGFQAGYAAAQRWIPVTERLPEVKQRVLVQQKAGFMDVRKCIDGGHLAWFYSDIVAWMPLPAQYQEGENDEETNKNNSLVGNRNE